MHSRPWLPLFACMVFFVVVALAGCSSSPSVDSSETYSGPPAVAIAPVGDARAIRSPQVSLWWIQKLMAQDLERSGVFAGVIRLENTWVEHEADLVIEPSLTDLRWRDAGQSGGDLSLRVRTVDKRSGKIGIDQVYSGDCSHCVIPPGQPPVAGPLADLMPKLTKSLRKKYGD